QIGDCIVQPVEDFALRAGPKCFQTHEQQEERNCEYNQEVAIHLTSIPRNTLNCEISKAKIIEWFGRAQVCCIKFRMENAALGGNVVWTIVADSTIFRNQDSGGMCLRFRLMLVGL